MIYTGEAREINQIIFIEYNVYGIQYYFLYFFTRGFKTHNLYEES